MAEYLEILFQNDYVITIFSFSLVSQTFSIANQLTRLIIFLSASGSCHLMFPLRCL
jgi:hypothetical protein